MPLYATEIATWLGKENPKKYKGHSFRRTAVTWCAESAMSVSNIKLVSGHTSDNVVQRYVNNTTTMKLNAAQALSTSPGILQKRNIEDIESTNYNNTLSMTESKKQNTNVYHVHIGQGAEITAPLFHIENK